MYIMFAVCGALILLMNFAGSQSQNGPSTSFTIKVDFASKPSAVWTELRTGNPKVTSSNPKIPDTEEKKNFMETSSSVFIIISIKDTD